MQPPRMGRDDGVLAGNVAAVRSTFDAFRTACSRHGLRINMDKCTVAASERWADEARRSFPEFTFHDELEILGAPCGSRGFCEDFAEAALSKAQRRLQLLANMGEHYPHEAAVCAQHTVVGSMPNHIARSVGPCPAIEAFDDASRAFWESVSGCSFTPQQWDVACLPASLGGLGVRSWSDHAICAFAARIHDCRKQIAACPFAGGLEEPLPSSLLVDIQAQLELLGQVKGSAQKALSLRVETCRRERIMEEAADPIAKARLVSSAARGSFAWFSHPFGGLPVKRFWRSPAEFSILIRLRLGVPLFARGSDCPFCGSRQDEVEAHILSCLRMGNRGILHSYLKDAVKEVCNAAGHTVSMEAHCFPRDPTARIDLLALDGAVEWLVDVACTNPISTSSRASAAIRPGHAATLYEGVKLQRYGHLVPPGARLVPFVVDMLGAWGATAAEWGAKVGKQIARRQRLYPGLGVQFVRASVGSAVARGVALLVMRALANSHDAAEADDGCADDVYDVSDDDDDATPTRLPLSDDANHTSGDVGEDAATGGSATPLLTARPQAL